MRSVKSSERTLAILEHFRIVRRPMTVGEIALNLKMPQSSTSMLLHNLAENGYLDQVTGTRAYIPSLRVAFLGDWIRTSMPATNPLSEVLKWLQRESGETVLLARESGPHIQYIEVEQEEQGVQMRMQPGIVRPMSLAACGHVLLAGKPIDEARAIIRRNNAEAITAAEQVSEAEMVHRLCEVALNGFSESDAKITSGASVIAIAVKPERMVKPLAIGVGCPLDRMAVKRQAIIELLKTVSDKLSSVNFRYSPVAEPFESSVS
jgi:IclR family acetate operon transcriptional repressor